MAEESRTDSLYKWVWCVPVLRDSFWAARSPCHVTMDDGPTTGGSEETHSSISG